MTKAFVVGHPIAHSRSPLIHGHWLETLNIPGSYERIDVTPEAFAAFLKSFPGEGFAGGNVTVPHKEAAFALAAERSATARALGAANTLWLENGALCADNTDVEGFLANLDERAPGWSESDKPAIVLGAGGAARAILYGLLQRGIGRIHLANRTLARAEALAAHFGPKIRPVSWSDLPAILPDAGLLVNSSSLGMKGQPPLDLALDALPDRAIVSDIVYVPLETPLLTRAKARNLRVVDGLGMLLHQAAPGFARWFGQRPRVTPALRALIEADIRKA